MCGIVSIVYGQENPHLGREAAALLKKLEYRGYDSTGAAFLDAAGGIVLKKRVGAPTLVIEELEIERDSGVRMLGQVRWATYGSVTDLNAQPHRMACRLPIVGAHNGNISNTDWLKDFLLDNGHQVLSDNDGEMLIHLVEHYLAEQIRTHPPDSPDAWVRAVTQAVRRAHRKAEGSYAACLALPGLAGVFAMKAGSSLYAGQGSDEAGEFTLISSDLTSVLSKTRFLIPLSEGEGIYFTHRHAVIFSLEEDRDRPPRLTRSRLNVGDISLHSRYQFFMHQEIATTPENVARLIDYYFYEDWEKPLFDVFEGQVEPCRNVVFELLKLYDIFEPPRLRAELDRLLAHPELARIHGAVRSAGTSVPPPAPFRSDEAQLLTELSEYAPTEAMETLQLLDLIVVWKKKRMIFRYRNELTQLMRRTAESGGRVYIIGAGTSYHAALTGGHFFNKLAGLSIIPANPGLFRSLYLDSLTPRDIVVGVTQSGETKDLLDIFNDIRLRHERSIPLVSIVNNENSTIPQEKSDFFLPILCGPEVAVAATKSFTSQLALFFLFALLDREPPVAARERMRHLVGTLDFTIQAVEEDVAEAALKLFLRPSLHILAATLNGIAREGALKVREVVLNHTEGYDTAEFKHGPNTILGKNTIYSLNDLEQLLRDTLGFCDELGRRRGGLDPIALRGTLETLRDIGFAPVEPPAGDGPGGGQWAVYDLFRQHVNLENYFRNYPLVFVCPPDERDIKITISQIHTHKIRGADILLIAQDHDGLRRAIEGRPAGFADYYSKYIRIPKMLDPELFPFQAAVALQLLAFRMSVAKMKHLNKNRVENHGVHPDVPKNVSKSITVD